MICYKDMAFCSAECSNMECYRKFNDEQRLAVELWWSGRSGDPPIAWADFSKLCPDFTPTSFADKKIIGKAKL